jgi:hypothetical protein
MLEKLLRGLVAKRSSMESEIFEHPPADWPAFQRRLGQYLELQNLIADLNEVMKGLEKDEE